MTMTRISLLIALAAAPAAAQTPAAATHAQAAHASGKHADGAIAFERAAGMLRDIGADNASFVQHHRARDFESFRDSQHPRAILVGCADSRFHIDAIDRSPDGDVFEIRNIGNQVDSSAGSVEYGIRHLHVPLLLVVGHVGCGAVRAAMDDYSGEPMTIRREIDGLHLSIFRTQAKGTVEQRWLANVIGNVHQQVADALEEYGDEVRLGHLYVVGAVYDFRGDLGARGALHFVNVNGEKDPKAVAASPLLAKPAAR